MSLRRFRCIAGHNTEIEGPAMAFAELVKFEAAQECACGLPARRVISAPMFRVDQTDYSCPVTGKRVGSRLQHEENLKQQNCRVLEAGETAASHKAREKAEAAFDKKIEDTVERTIEGYSSDKKEKLANELINGNLDVSVERK